jgi:hypothetical protein
LDELHSEDDDTVYLPEWMFEKLRIAVGDPVCLIFDFEMNKTMIVGEMQVASEVTMSINKVEKSKMRQRKIVKSGDEVRAGVARENMESSIVKYPEGMNIDEERIEKDFLLEFE